MRKNNRKLYTCKAVETALPELCDTHNIYTLPGSLLDSYIAVPINDNYKYIAFLETALNCWSSAYIINQYRSYNTMPKWLKEELAAVEEL